MRKIDKLIKQVEDIRRGGLLLYTAIIEPETKDGRQTGKQNIIADLYNGKPAGTSGHRADQRNYTADSIEDAIAILDKLAEEYGTPEDGATIIIDDLIS